MAFLRPSKKRARSGGCQKGRVGVSIPPTAFVKHIHVTTPHRNETIFLRRETRKRIDAITLKGVVPRPWYKRRKLRRRSRQVCAHG